jgi:hypothetical protein
VILSPTAWYFLGLMAALAMVLGVMVLGGSFFG